MVSFAWISWNKLKHDNICVWVVYFSFNELYLCLTLLLIVESFTLFIVWIWFRMAFYKILHFMNCKNYSYWPCPITEKDLFISISRNYIIISVHVDKYLHVLMLCWKIHLIPMRNSQDMDHWNIYLQFWGHVRLGDSTYNCTCTNNRNIQNLALTLNFSIPQNISEDRLWLSYLYFNFFYNVTKKIAAVMHSIEIHYRCLFNYIIQWCN